MTTTTFIIAIIIIAGVILYINYENTKKRFDSESPNLYVKRTSNKGTSTFKILKSGRLDSKSIVPAWQIQNPFTDKIKFISLRVNERKKDFENIQFFWNSSFQIASIDWNDTQGFVVNLTGKTKEEDTIDLNKIEELIALLEEHITKPFERDKAQAYRQKFSDMSIPLFGSGFTFIFITVFAAQNYSYYYPFQFFKISLFLAICIAIIVFFYLHNVLQDSVFYRNTMLYSILLFSFVTCTFSLSGLYLTNNAITLSTCSADTKIVNTRMVSGKSKSYFANVEIPLSCRSIFNRDQNEVRISSSFYYSNPQSVKINVHKGLFQPYMEAE